MGFRGGKAMNNGRAMGACERVRREGEKREIRADREVKVETARDATNKAAFAQCFCRRQMKFWRAATHLHNGAALIDVFSYHRSNWLFIRHRLLE